MQIKPGQYYKTRNGNKIEVFKTIEGNFLGIVNHSVYTFDIYGRSPCEGLDILSEWEDTVIERWIYGVGTHPIKIRIDPTAPKGQRIVEVE